MCQYNVLLGKVKSKINVNESKFYVLMKKCEVSKKKVEWSWALEMPCQSYKKIFLCSKPKTVALYPENK